MALSKFPFGNNLGGLGFWFVALVCLSLLFQKPIYLFSRPYLYLYQQYFEDQKVLTQSHLVPDYRLGKLSRDDCRSLRVVDGEFDLGFAIPKSRNKANAQLRRIINTLPKQTRENVYKYKLTANDVPGLKKGETVRLRLKPNSTFSDIEQQREELQRTVQTWSYEVELYDCAQSEELAKKLIQRLAKLSL